MSPDVFTQEDDYATDENKSAVLLNVTDIQSSFKVDGQTRKVCQVYYV